VLMKETEALIGFEFEHCNMIGFEVVYCSVIG